MRFKKLNEEKYNEIEEKVEKLFKKYKVYEYTIDLSPDKPLTRVEFRLWDPNYRDDWCDFKAAIKTDEIKDGKFKLIPIIDDKVSTWVEGGEYKGDVHEKFYKQWKHIEHCRDMLINYKNILNDLDLILLRNGYEIKGFDGLII